MDLITQVGKSWGQPASQTFSDLLAIAIGKGFVVGSAPAQNGNFHMMQRSVVCGHARGPLEGIERQESALRLKPVECSGENHCFQRLKDYLRKKVRIPERVMIIAKKRKGGKEEEGGTATLQPKGIAKHQVWFTFHFIDKNRKQLNHENRRVLSRSAMRLNLMRASSICRGLLLQQPATRRAWVTTPSIFCFQAWSPHLSSLSSLCILFETFVEQVEHN